MNPRKYTLPHIIYLSHRLTVSCLPLFYVSFFLCCPLHPIIEDDSDHLPGPLSEILSGF